MRPIEPSDLMLATLYNRPFSDPEWLFEIKYDGFRCLVRKAGGRVDLLSRNGNSFNGSFPDVVSAISGIFGDFTFDAELTVDDAGGRPSFERLQRRAVTRTAKRVPAASGINPARLYLFDALSIDGEDLRALPLHERKERLRDSFVDTQTLIYASGVRGAGEWVFERAKSLDLEGMVAKRLDSTYRKGRTRDWLKIKYGGYSRPAGFGFGWKA